MRELNKTLREIYEEMTGVEIAKQIAGSPVGLQDIKNWTLWSLPRNALAIHITLRNTNGSHIILFSNSIKTL
jgi:hypothetical protein